MGLVPDIDEQASRDNARDLLKDFRRIARMAGRPLTDIKSPTVTDIPRATGYGNLQEKRLTETFDAQQTLETIIQALALLPVQSYWVLFYSYCTPEPLTGYEIAARLNVDNDGVVRYMRHRALMEFAEAFPGEKLLVFC
ncbi:ArpU family phage packaging/lysis transcriptional regulator [Lacticaseibacillus parakribbianus]|uniref:ArpU family phage packaging/lysis transcriptional regulator n=1 Tax=Lacticaseibacillus parakribbianus TaxID=2970927 RepID=UPI0021CB7EAA|nr:ArpU family phage packaging/lysis transcriptional regulator [Lacticaseibacillus parakribbianus]